MNELRRQVERFYRDLWDNHDKEAIPEVLHEDFTFRGSLGQEKRGHPGFAEYVDMVHAALGDYKCTIDDLVVEPPKVFARMSFAGIHRGLFMGCAPTGKEVRWAGAALFTFRGRKIADVWVLGDLKGLEAQLKENETQRDMSAGH
jgi:predicted ester cyclase